MSNMTSYIRSLVVNPGYWTGVWRKGDDVKVVQLLCGFTSLNSRYSKLAKRHALGLHVGVTGKGQGHCCSKQKIRIRSRQKLWFVRPILNKT